MAHGCFLVAQMENSDDLAESYMSISSSGEEEDCLGESTSIPQEEETEYDDPSDEDYMPLSSDEEMSAADGSSLSDITEEEEMELESLGVDKLSLQALFDLVVLLKVDVERVLARVNNNNANLTEEQLKKWLISKVKRMALDPAIVEIIYRLVYDREECEEESEE